VPETAAPEVAPVQIPALADAFAALLSAEARVQYLPSAVRAGGAAPANDPAFVDAIVDRVLARLGDSPLRTTVLDAAERLVKEEIARLKGNS
jgi:hypothetical protein